MTGDTTGEPVPGSEAQAPVEGGLDGWSASAETAAVPAPAPAEEILGFAATSEPYPVVPRLRLVVPPASATPGGPPSGVASAAVAIVRGWLSRRRPVVAAGGETADTGTPAVLSAVYHYDDGSHRGSVQVVNAGGGEAADWTVTLSVPGGEPVTVTSGEVAVAQSGTVVTFRPAGAALGAGDTVTFGFGFAAAPTSAPVGCAVNGSARS
ncbi:MULTISPECIES: cellulose binding domain-containing protein [unclassified Actinoplanes]|uniref:cellulose binding domain-containing protein n=1 Tax=unclassified Actinoplanes TaxID=2626549 RepID=UPI0005BAE45D|nr:MULTISPECIES: cellulose binding domain-containing protein [unclassified Actinoplanes]